LINSSFIVKFEFYNIIMDDVNSVINTETVDDTKITTYKNGLISTQSENTCTWNFPGKGWHYRTINNGHTVIEYTRQPDGMITEISNGRMRTVR
jgi:hypothetical protein